VTRARWALGLYLLVLLVVVSYPIGPPRVGKLRLLTDAKPRRTEALLRDVAINVALFVPVGLFGAWAGGASGTTIVLVVAAGVGLSLAIETVQHFWLPWRYSSSIDVVNNTVGAALGAATAGVRRRWPGRWPTSEAALTRTR
jgi:VanZ family protein